MLSVSNGAYLRAKRMVDQINIIVCIVALCLTGFIFIAPFAWADGLIPLVFLCGTIVNGCHAIKWHFKFQGKKVALMVCITLVMFAITVYSAVALW
ncbi:MAG: hypothetical protein K6C69_03665 [Lachnospiraceae bacterium]|nr:hypothetical protein [Lachnospiraceae bacterium]